MPPIVTTAEIDRPAARVFACATDPALFAQWQKGVGDAQAQVLDVADGLVERLPVAFPPAAIAYWIVTAHRQA